MKQHYIRLKFLNNQKIGLCTSAQLLNEFETILYSLKFFYNYEGNFTRLILNEYATDC